MWPACDTGGYNYGSTRTLALLSFSSAHSLFVRSFRADGLGVKGQIRTAGLNRTHWPADVKPGLRLWTLWSLVLKQSMDNVISFYLTHRPKKLTLKGYKQYWCTFKDTSISCYKSKEESSGTPAHQMNLRGKPWDDHCWWWNIYELIFNIRILLGGKVFQQFLHSLHTFIYRLRLFLLFLLHLLPDWSAGSDGRRLSSPGSPAASAAGGHLLAACCDFSVGPPVVF